MTKERTFGTPEFLDALESLSNESYDFAMKQKGLGHEGGLGYYYFGRCVSCFMGVKTLLFTMELSGQNDEFVKQYLEKGLAARFPVRNIYIARKYMQETHMAIRFVLFQNFYSQTEFTYKIIQREKFPKLLNANPYRLMTDQNGIMSVDFVKFINAVRNTIHNNGYYFPKYDTADLKYEFNGKTHNFVYGKPIDSVTMWDIIDIITYVLRETEKLFEKKELAEIKFAS